MLGGVAELWRSCVWVIKHDDQWLELHEQHSVIGEGVVEGTREGVRAAMGGGVQVG